MDEELKTKILELYDEEDDSIEVVEEEDWVQEHKYQYRDVIIKYDDKFYRISESRSGSYHTDWYYDDNEICEVVGEEVVIKKTIWKAV